MNRKNKKQFVEHYEEYIGEDVAPFVSYWSKENQTKTTANQQNTNVSPMPMLTTATRKKRIRFWRRLTAIFS